MRSLSGSPTRRSRAPGRARSARPQLWPYVRRSSPKGVGPVNPLVGEEGVGEYQSRGGGVFEEIVELDHCTQPGRPWRSSPSTCCRQARGRRLRSAEIRVGRTSRLRSSQGSWERSVLPQDADGRAGRLGGTLPAAEVAARSTGAGSTRTPASPHRGLGRSAHTTRLAHDDQPGWGMTDEPCLTFSSSQCAESARMQRAWTKLSRSGGPRGPRTSLGRRRGRI